MAKLKIDRQQIGRWGEALAERYFLERGDTILGKNVRTPYGEIDLIVRSQDHLGFVEVKTRTNSAFGLPETAITQKKREHMIHAAEAYLQDNPEIELAWQIDVIAIQGAPDRENVEITYFENAIT